MLDRTSDFINLSRWLAAFVVVASHLRQLIMCDYSLVQSPGIFTKLLYFFTQLGHEAVMVFFVVSGYLIGGAAIIRSESMRFDPVDYASHRIARIYSAFLPALLLFGMLDVLGCGIFSGTGLYTKVLGISSLSATVSERIAPLYFLGNVAMVQYGVVPPFGSNGPLWSLAYEWWYYVIFGAIMIVNSDRSTLARGAAVCLTAMLLWFLSWQLLLWGLIWLLGTFTAIYAARGYAKPPLWVALPLAVAIIVFARISHMGIYDAMVSKWRFIIDAFVAIGYAGLLLSFHRKGRQSAVPKLHRQLAGFSYSLYLIHFPLMLFTIAFLSLELHLPFMAQPGLTSFLYYSIVLASLVTVAWLFSMYTESKTAAVRITVLGVLRKIQANLGGHRLNK